MFCFFFTVVRDGIRSNDSKVSHPMHLKWVFACEGNDTGRLLMFGRHCHRFCRHFGDLFLVLRALATKTAWAILRKGYICLRVRAAMLLSPSGLYIAGTTRYTSCHRPALTMTRVTRTATGYTCVSTPKSSCQSRLGTPRVAKS